ncbi:Sir2 family NAD-dependent protein deacetylase [Lactobacillus sp. ESL0785]|uniref:Sir2 family NAD-dependent protein deacetylase n=1 Tax=Lactobacillus sp. ESL0785 TaxID=2983232 RepID=UPI0023F7D4A5|nr:Sir2 family NAD-dependent protein deacetylase [Lactobacillus sp. ESL0785]WEV71139.1 Sir2 family NAD-dependent protein deacetylase [Lactobacillus sp. ESL0785]
MEDFSKARKMLADADAIIVTAGNGMAQVEGLDMLSQEQFACNFPMLVQKENILTVGDALDKKFSSWQEQWLLWSVLIQKYSLDYHPSKAMLQLANIIGRKKYFIATATFGHFFEKAGFNEKRIFNVFGDWTKMQCSSGINHGQRDDVSEVRNLLAAQKKGKITADLIPKCHVCGRPMEINLPLTAHFYPDTDANTRFRWFLTGNEDNKVVFLELGVDETSPQLREPVIHLVQQFPQWSYVAADMSQEQLPVTLKQRSVVTTVGPAALLKELELGS